MKAWSALIPLASIAVLGGCAASPAAPGVGSPGASPAPSAPATSIAPSYEYVLEAGECECFGGEFHITVEDGAVVDWAAREPTAKSVVEYYAQPVEEWLVYAEDVVRDGGSATITWDAEHRWPTRIRFDPMPNSIDDEFTLTFSEIEIADP
jgi:hypothetical protein